MFDESGVERTDRWNPGTSLFLPLPPRSQLQLEFSEPMDPNSFRPYESLFVVEAAVSPTIRASPTCAWA